MTVDSVNPIQEGDHSSLNFNSSSGDAEIRSSSRSAYIGGYVYRGPVAELQGKYFYADFVQGNIFALDFDRDTPLEDISGTNLNLQDIPGEQDDLARVGEREVVLNRNLNSLWHTIMVDPLDPTYTPALGDEFGIGRIVSFGEDNAGNLYIVDMGGERGNVGFGNDYPAGATGQIFRIAPLTAPPVTLTINRETGEVTLANESDAPLEFTEYSIVSPNGAIDPSSIVPISGNYDVPIPPGDGSIDDNDSWQITFDGNNRFGEETTGDEGTLAADAMIVLGGEGAWVQSLFEDWSVQVSLPDGSVVVGSVEFIGNDGNAFERSDLNFDGVLDTADWPAFRDNNLTDLSGLSEAERYGRGDLDGDGDNDFDDFVIFKGDYNAANGVGAFEAEIGAVIPEPATATLLLLGSVGALAARCRCRRPRG